MAQCQVIFRYLKKYNAILRNNMDYGFIDGVKAKHTGRIVKNFFQRENITPLLYHHRLT